MAGENPAGAQIVGNVGDNDPDVGGPVKVGARVNTTLPTYVDGDRADAQADTSGRLLPADINLEGTAFASAARTVTENSADQTNLYGRGIKLFLDITAAAGTTPTLDITIQNKDPASAKYFDIPGAAFAQKVTTGQDELIIHPAVTVVADEAFSNGLAQTWRAVATIAGGGGETFTFTLGWCLLR